MPRLRASPNLLHHDVRPSSVQVHSVDNDTSNEPKHPLRCCFSAASLILESNTTTNFTQNIGRSALSAPASNSKSTQQHFWINQLKSRTYFFNFISAYLTEPLVGYSFLHHYPNLQAICIHKLSPRALQLPFFSSSVHGDQDLAHLSIPFLATTLYQCCFYEIKSSLYSRYYVEVCNQRRDPSPRLSAWTTQLRRNVAAVASRWRLRPIWSAQESRPKPAAMIDASLTTTRFA